MAIEEIKAGSCIKQEYDTESSYGILVKYYLVLFVDSENIEVISYKGSPMPDAVVYDWKQITSNYSVVIIPESNVKEDYLYDEYVANGLERKVIAGIKYTWEDKEVIIPSDDYVYTNTGFWKLDKSFYGTLIKSAIKEAKDGN